MSAWRAFCAPWVRISKECESVALVGSIKEGDGYDTEKRQGKRAEKRARQDAAKYIEKLTEKCV